MDVVQNQEHSVDFVLPIDGPLPDAMFAEGHFDLVLCTEVLEHVADWSAAFENLIRLCVVGGRVILTCPQFYPPHEEPYDFWRPTPNAITWHARRAGFEVEKLERGGDLWGVLGTILGGHTVASVSHRLRSRIIGRLVRVAFRLAFWALESGWLQSHCRAIPITLGSFHLSNLAVLRKP
jgi:SAM-dependent methyltransferase